MCVVRTRFGSVTKRCNTYQDIRRAGVVVPAFLHGVLVSLTLYDLNAGRGIIIRRLCLHIRQGGM